MIGTRHARPDKRILAAAFRPKEVFSLSMIAGMAHSTLKAKAATQDGVAFRYQLKIRVKQPPGRGTDCPVFVKIRQRTWPISFAIRCDWINGQDLNDSGRMPERDRTRIFGTFSDSFLSGIVRHGKPQLPCRSARIGTAQRVIYNQLIAFPA
jgi:hypothetical protein